jgi:dephospho-CoA kinase
MSETNGLSVKRSYSEAVSQRSGRPTLVGLTGGIGSGKSTIAAELARRGCRVYDCDREAKRIIAENPDVQAQIIALLGEEAFQRPKTNDQRPVYNTQYVAKCVFEDKQLLAQLNAIVHPAVAEDIKANGQQLTANSPLFIESAILYESGFDRLCDRVVYVDAPEEVRIARTVQRDHCDAAQVRARIRSQQTQPHEKAIVLMNDGSVSVAQLAEQILSLI